MHFWPVGKKIVLKSLWTFSKMDLGQLITENLLSDLHKSQLWLVDLSGISGLQALELLRRNI